MTPPPHPLLAAARRLAPELARRSEEIEAARRLPADLSQQLAEAGFFRLVVPEAYGGHELHPAHVIDVLEALAWADGSTGWCVMIGALTAMCAAWLPEPVARAIYGVPDMVTGGVAAPLGRAERVEGGYRVTGRWAWASGAPNCRWLTGGAWVTQDGQPVMNGERPVSRIFFFPAEDVTLHDTWHAAGLCGTGSVDLEARDVFVPAERGLSLSTERPRIDRPLYRLPAYGLLAVGIPAVALGIARRALDELRALARPALAHRPAVHTAVAEAEATLRAARALLHEAVHTAFEATRHQDATPRQRAELRLAYVHATREAARVVDRMYDVAGGAAVHRASPLQRCLRDVHAATQHAMVGQPLRELIGAVLLGQEANLATL
ncbi:acyl-CoA dehydrogenase family protein [Archangium primigenium]|uniref:acyl-CoA dehydrogenase family protein n=1 Tax=[Archangium] primigenium TaxID=2792470 RepID=UPI00195D603E|nr:acyl-CoA dehydrogenase family protein [Archangium primigenium]MBM7116629.1 acyl-CoA dehydrogenase family protein [Archangium primigenium]